MQSAVRRMQSSERRKLTMSKKRGLAILGGDRRQIAAARYLSFCGYPVFVWGLGECRDQIGNAVLCDTWEQAIEAADAVILPLPASADGVRIHCPLHDRDVLLRVTSLLGKIGGRLLLGGRISEPIRSIAEQLGVRWIDYFESEVLQLKNAVPTAEGAIAIAMRELPVTLDGISAAVIGYGRIGEILSQKLAALGAHVTVYARRTEPLTRAALCHHGTRRLIASDVRSAPEGLSEFRVIFNTVPHRLLTRGVLETLRRDCVLIDLASAPGGIDFSAAEELGLRAVWGTALPGKCAPESAGEILAQSITVILDETEGSLPL